jgi:hypothetical protein
VVTGGWNGPECSKTGLNMSDKILCLILIFLFSITGCGGQKFKEYPTCEIKKPIVLGDIHLDKTLGASLRTLGQLYKTPVKHDGEVAISFIDFSWSDIPEAIKKHYLSSDCEVSSEYFNNGKPDPTAHQLDIHLKEKYSSETIQDLLLLLNYPLARDQVFFQNLQNDMKDYAHGVGLSLSGKFKGYVSLGLGSKNDPAAQDPDVLYVHIEFTNKTDFYP